MVLKCTQFVFVTAASIPKSKNILTNRKDQKVQKVGCAPVAKSAIYSFSKVQCTQ